MVLAKCSGFSPVVLTKCIGFSPVVLAKTAPDSKGRYLVKGTAICEYAQKHFKRKFKESVAISQEKKDNLLNKKKERRFISDISF